MHDTWNELIPVEDAAASLGIPVKRLIGFMARNSLADPIGDERQVYRGSLKELRKRLADGDTAAQP